MADFEGTGRDEQRGKPDANEKRNQMSSRPKNGGDRHAAQPGARRPQMAIWAGAIGALIVVAIIVYAVLQGNRSVPGSAVAPGTPQLPPPLPVGARAPDFELKSQIGMFSSSALSGTPYLLEIFATWCPHCQRMTKVLRQVRSQFPESKLGMLAVTGSPYAANSTPDNLVPENQDDVDRYESTYNVTWPTLLDTDLVVARKYGLDGFPTIFIVNAKGTIVYSTSGEVPLATLVAAIHRAGG